jgi:hypothetical protein
MAKGESSSQVNALAQASIDTYKNSLFSTNQERSMSGYGGSISSPAKDNNTLPSAMMRQKKVYRVPQGSISYQASGVRLPYNQGLATTQIIPGTADSINIGTPGSI